MGNGIATPSPQESVGRSRKNNVNKVSALSFICGLTWLLDRKGIQPAKNMHRPQGSLLKQEKKENPGSNQLIQVQLQNGHKNWDAKIKLK